MAVDLQFIKSVSGAFRAEGEASNLCCTKRMKPANANYSSYEYQLVYGARYLPAYYVEYVEAAQLLASRLPDRAAIAICSLGCGLCQDYHAFSHALRGVADFIYVGCDAVDWTARSLMPPAEGNFSFIESGVQSLNAEYVQYFDVFAFPKSLTDIQRSGCLPHLASVVGATNKKRLFFVNSYVSNDAYYYGSFEVIEEELFRAGFSLAYSDGPWRVSAGRIDDKYPGFDSSVGKINCERSDLSSADCRECEAQKHPIKLGEYSYYELREYSRP